MDKIDELMKLSINERQCIAIICFERYCIKYRISNKGIDDFINHIWKVVTLKNNYIEWINGFVDLEITGQSDPFSESLKNAVPKDLLLEFMKMCEYVYETSAVCWFGAESNVSGEMLLKIFKILKKHKIEIPDIKFYQNKTIKDIDGWSEPIDEDTLKKWKESV